MAEAVIWHNPGCSKSRETLALLQAAGHAPQVRLYLQDAPDADDIRGALAALAIPARDLLRWTEPAVASLGLTPDLGEDVLIAAMAAQPALIERPLVLAGGKAALGRPPAAVLALF